MYDHAEMPDWHDSARQGSGPRTLGDAEPPGVQGIGSLPPGGAGFPVMTVDLHGAGRLVSLGSRSGPVTAAIGFRSRQHRESCRA